MSRLDEAEARAEGILNDEHERAHLTDAYHLAQDLLDALAVVRAAKEHRENCERAHHVPCGLMDALAAFEDGRGEG